MHAPFSPSLPSVFLLRGGLAMTGVLACLAGLGLSSTRAHADAAACKALTTAMIANTKTPFHSFATISFDYSSTVGEAVRKMKLPREQKSETIFTGKAVYVRLLPGKWQALPTSLAQFQANVRASVAGFKNCQRLPDAKADDGAVAIYMGDTQQRQRPVETKIWVSAQGVPVKSETDIDLAGPRGVETIRQRLLTRYEYGNIQAPALD